MSTKQAWEDYGQVIGLINRTISDIQAIVNQIDKLKELKIEILDDTERKNNLKDILDVHPDFSITWAMTRYTKLQALKTWLEDNSYIE